MKRVMVTGATTPIGVALVRALLDEPSVQQIVAVGREGEPAPAFPRSARLAYVATDLRRSRSLRSLLFGSAREVDTVVHGALHRSAHRTGPQAHRLHADTARQLLQLCEEHPSIERLVLQSSGAIYRMDDRQPAIIDERQPLNLAPKAPQWIRDRVEADLTVCAWMGMSRTKLAVLRFAECLAPNMGGQLYDYLTAPVCFRPLGFDPVLNLLSLGDTVRALVCAVKADAEGVFNVPGRDTLPLSQAIRLWGHRGIPAPGPLMAPLYRARAFVTGSEFRYDINHWRFHLSGVLSGRRAREILGYEPLIGIDWPSGGALPPPARRRRNACPEVPPAATRPRRERDHEGQDDERRASPG
jgi:UDP-glucose 4-epimerase